MYEKLREELNISHDMGKSLGPNPDNAITPLNFSKPHKY